MLIFAFEANCAASFDCSFSGFQPIQPTVQIYCKMVNLTCMFYNVSIYQFFRTLLCLGTFTSPPENSGSRSATPQIRSPYFQPLQQDAGGKTPKIMRYEGNLHLFIIRQYILSVTLFRNKRFVLNLMLQRNASKFAIFL